MSRVLGGIKGAMGNLQHTPYIGPKSLNGGEVIIAAGKFSHCCRGTTLMFTRRSLRIHAQNAKHGRSRRCR